MKFTELIEQVLIENKNKPMSGKEIWEYATSKGYDKQLSTNGKTPDQTMKSVLYNDMKKNENYQKYNVFGNLPKKFALKK